MISCPMYTQSSGVIPSERVRCGSCCPVGISAAVLVVLGAVDANAEDNAGNWQNATTAFLRDPDSLAWGMGSNWTSGVPVANAMVYLHRGSSGSSAPGAVDLNSRTDAYAAANISHGTNLWLAAGGVLRITASGGVTIGETGNSIVTIDAGGKISMAGPSAAGPGPDAKRVGLEHSGP